MDSARDQRDQYVPKEGDIVWIDFDPASGKEIKKRRPALVISKFQFNLTTGFAVACPITSTVKNFPTRYSLPDTTQTHGQIIVSQLKSFDFSCRKLEFIEQIPAQDLAIIQQIVRYIFAD